MRVTPEMEATEKQPQRLSLVDINQSTVKKTWPLLLSALEKAHFTSVDLELSGLGLHLTRGTVVPDEKYKLLREVASSYAIISMGVACFQWQPGPMSSGSIPCKVEVFNILLLSQCPYTMDPSSAKFLLKHGFDFNKQLHLGLPYTPVGVVSKTNEAKECRLVDLFRRLVLSPAPLVVHNGWVDLLFLYHACHAPLPPTRDSLIADLVEIFEQGGVYDTKAIAQYHSSEERTFLEYIFKKAFVRNQRHEGVWLDLLMAGCPSLPSCTTEEVMLPRIPHFTMPELMSVAICPKFMRHGCCAMVGCGRSHDLILAILQEDRVREAHRLRRKRRRGCHKIHTDDSASLATSPTPSNHSLSDLFKDELAAAKTNLLYDSVSHDPVKESCDWERSCGHRAGFDAFMTGFTFACFALNSCKHLPSHPTPNHSPTPHTSHTPTTEQHEVPPPHPTPHQLLEGLTDMRNCLSNTSLSVPVRIARSQFSRPSQAHKAAWQRVQVNHQESLESNPQTN